jgi:hypothetical protein
MLSTEQRGGDAVSLNLIEELEARRGGIKANKQGSRFSSSGLKRQRFPPTIGQSQSAPDSVDGSVLCLMN